MGVLRCLQAEAPKDPWDAASREASGISSDRVPRGILWRCWDWKSAAACTGAHKAVTLLCIEYLTLYSRRYLVLFADRPKVRYKLAHDTNTVLSLDIHIVKRAPYSLCEF